MAKKEKWKWLNYKPVNDKFMATVQAEPDGKYTVELWKKFRYQEYYGRRGLCQVKGVSYDDVEDTIADMMGRVKEA